jgi:hypothetical protein
LSGVLGKLRHAPRVGAVDPRTDRRHCFPYQDGQERSPRRRRRTGGTSVVASTSVREAGVRAGTERRDTRRPVPLPRCPWRWAPP